MSLNHQKILIISNYFFKLRMKIPCIGNYYNWLEAEIAYILAGGINKRLPFEHKYLLALCRILGQYKRERKSALSAGEKEDITELEK